MDFIVLNAMHAKFLERVVMSRLCRCWPSAGIHVFFLATIALAAVYYRDRMLGDISHLVWCIANSEKFAISYSRYSDMLFQWPAVTAAKAGASLQTVAMLFSVTFIAYYYAIAIILLHCFRDLRAAGAVVLLFVVVSTHGWIYPTSAEFGLVTLFLLPALMRRRESTKIALSCAALASFACLIAASFHALAILVGLFFLAILLADPSKYSRGAVLFTMALLALLAVYRLFFGGIEQEEMGRIHLSQWADFAGRFGVFAQIHFPILLLFALTAVLLLIRSRFLMASIFTAAMSAQLMLILLRHDPAETSWIYLWHINMSMYALAILTIVIALPKPRTWEKLLLAGAVVLLATQSLSGMVIDVRWYRERRALITRLTNSAEKRGLTCATVDQHVLNKMGPFAWAIGDESILQTSTAASSITRMVAPEKRITWHPIWVWSINPRRFTLPERIREDMFTKLNTLATAQEIQRTAQQSLRLSYDPPRDWKAGDVLYLPLTLTNQATTPLPSRSSDKGALCLTYAWIQNGKPLPNTTPAQPLEVDVYSSYTQPLKVLTPPTRADQKLVCYLRVGDTIIAQQ